MGHNFSSTFLHNIVVLIGCTKYPKKIIVMEIIATVHLIPNIVANPYLIMDPDGLTLIDTGLPGNHKKILNYMTGLGYSPSDLTRIIITHADMDHIGSLSALKKASGARVYASAPAVLQPAGPASATASRRHAARHRSGEISRR